LTGMEFLRQYIMIERQIRSIRLQLESTKELVSKNMLNNFFKPGIDDLTDSLKSLISKSVIVKENILNKIQTIENNECREILIKHYIELKTVSCISKEMFMTRQGVYYHLHAGEKSISALI